MIDDADHYSWSKFTVRGFYGTELLGAIEILINSWDMPRDAVYQMSTSEDFWYFASTEDWFNFWNGAFDPVYGYVSWYGGFLYIIEDEWHEIDYDFSIERLYGESYGNIDGANFRSYWFTQEWREGYGIVHMGKEDMRYAIEKVLMSGLGLGACWWGNWFPWVDCMMETRWHYSPLTHQTLCGWCGDWMAEQYLQRGWMWY